ncbi:MAG: hypothetical protein HY254_12745 [Burkholderiales bacterium]|nr:hypothetical protein [Burkholderiales bacterium]
MMLNDDAAKNIVLHWTGLPSPVGGVQRRLLACDVGDDTRVTSIVRLSATSILSVFTSRIRLVPDMHR